jgi:hypothetical protein
MTKLAFTLFDYRGKDWLGLGLAYRRILMALVLAEVCYCFYIFNTQADFALYGQCMLIGSGALSAYLSIRGTVRYITPVVLSLFYLLGYPLYLAVMLMTQDRYTIGGWMAVGNFDFGREHLTRLGVASGILMLGLFLGCRMVQAAVPGRVLAAERLIAISEKRLRLWITVWFLLSMGLILFFAALGLGRTGLQDATTLPLGMKGVLYYVRVMLVPILGAFLLQQAANSRDWKNLLRVLVCSFIIAGAVAVFTLSRSDTVIILLPLIGYLLMHPNAQLRRTALRAIVPCVVGIVLMTQVVVILRNVAFSVDGFTLDSVSSVLDDTGKVSFGDIADNLLILLTVRQGGARDMGVVMTSSYTDVRYVWTFFAEVAEMDFMTDVWGFAVDEIEQEGKSFGSGFLGFAWYFFGQNLALLFFLAVVTGAFLVWVEDIFLRRGWRCVQIWVAFYLALLLWNNFGWGRVRRVLPMLIAAYFLMEYLARKKRTRELTVVPVQQSEA